ncbi:MAG: C45 family peptidase [Thermoplasmata archaeon]|nr:C45 family peptidase [Thermoplasmata archaeon]
MAKSAGLPVIEVSGKPFDMGMQAGRKCAQKTRAYRKAISAGIQHYTGKSWRKAVERAKDYLPFAEDFYPDFVDEIRGHAEGSGIPFEETFALCCHELLSVGGFKGCTDVVVTGDMTADGRVLAGHNEDWDASCLPIVVLLKAKPSRKPSFVCTSYAGLLPSTGFNDKGICLTGNALSPNDTRLGIPKVFPVRKVFEAKRIGEALNWAMPKERASSYNNICSDRNGEVYSLEGSATDCAYIYARDGYLVHTNHYTSERMRRFEEDPGAMTCSLVRYNRALRLIEGQRGGVTVESMIGLFRDHVNKPDSICRHGDTSGDPLDSSETIFSTIYDLTRMELHVCKGHPCENKYATMKLKE